jgi:hypothetical protein
VVDDGMTRCSCCREPIGRNETVFVVGDQVNHERCGAPAPVTNEAVERPPISESSS